MSAYCTAKAVNTPVFGTYSRIGHDNCPNTPGTFLVYEGFTAGFTTSTGSTTFKCLPTGEEHISYYDDQDSKYTDHSEVRFVNVTEYRTFVRGGTTNYFDAVCAVCLVNGRDTIQVLPATDTCMDSSWTKEYDGYFMTDNSGTFSPVLI